MSRVLVFGTFDQLHPGHEFFLSYASKQGSELVVVVARDQTVQEVKNRLPVQEELLRQQVLAAHPVVDQAVLGSLGDKYAVVEQVSPSVIVLGYDQVAFTSRLEEELVSRGVSCVVKRCTKSFQPHKYKSSLLR